VCTDNVENNIHSIANDTSAAAEELTTAADYQRKAGKRAACLMIVLVFVVAIVLLAVRLYPSIGSSKVQSLCNFCIRLARVKVIKLLPLVLRWVIGIP
jgi:cytochrome bd-type quinol oxidase subunit 2